MFLVYFCPFYAIVKKKNQLISFLNFILYKDKHNIKKIKAILIVTYLKKSKE